MSFLLKLLFAFCIAAGMANGLVHKSDHNSNDECASQHSQNHDGSGHDHGNGDTDAPPHHHDCCHFPTADRPVIGLSLSAVTHTHLVEIVSDSSLFPDEPVYALDKPPLI